MDNKLDYIIEKIKNIKNINILELGVQRGLSTKKFLDVCEDNNGFLTSIDIDDCSDVSKSDKWKFIHSSDDDFEKIDKIISKSFDFIFIDSLHEPNHVKKIFYHYYDFLKVDGLCIIDDISWIPYTKDEHRNNEFSENINRATFKTILEIYNMNKKNFLLEFFFKDSGYAVITKKKNNILSPSKKIISRELTIKNLIRKIYKRMPKK
jgi:predicted O-methyltransferase YrrM